MGRALHFGLTDRAAGDPVEWSRRVLLIVCLLCDRDADKHLLQATQLAVPWLGCGDDPYALGRAYVGLPARSDPHYRAERKRVDCWVTLAREALAQVADRPLRSTSARETADRGQPLDAMSLADRERELIAFLLSSEHPVIGKHIAPHTEGAVSEGDVQNYTLGVRKKWGKAAIENIRVSGYRITPSYLDDVRKTMLDNKLWPPEDVPER